MASEEREALALCFRHFAAHEARGRSSLYECLANAIGELPHVASLLLEAPVEQRRPTLLFAAVHDLLLHGIEHPLADYYPSVGGRREPDEELMESFRDFCAGHRDVLRRLMSTRNTQTNEVRRSPALLPALQQAPYAFQDSVEGLVYLITLSRLVDGERVSDELLGRSDPHGKWIEWIAD